MAHSGCLQEFLSTLTLNQSLFKDPVFATCTPRLCPATCTLFKHRRSRYPDKAAAVSIYQISQLFFSL